MATPTVFLSRRRTGRAAEKVLQIELHAEIALGSGGPIEGHQDVDIAAGGRRIAGGRAEQRQPGYAKAGLQLRLGAAQQFKGALSVNGSTSHGRICLLAIEDIRNRRAQLGDSKLSGNIASAMS